MTEPDKLDPRSHDIAAEKRRGLLRLLPRVRTEMAGGWIRRRNAPNDSPCA